MRECWKDYFGQHKNNFKLYSSNEAVTIFMKTFRENINIFHCKSYYTDKKLLHFLHQWTKYFQFLVLFNFDEKIMHCSNNENFSEWKLFGNINEKHYEHIS